MPVVQAVQRLVARVLTLRPVRAFQGYAGRRGPILASGLAYQALFSIFAAVWVLFSVAGLVLTGDDVLRQQLIAGLSDAVPGLIGSGSGDGAIDPNTLLQAGTFSWTGIIALVGVLFTALGFLASARDAIREMFGLAQWSGNVVLAKLKDFVFLIGFAAVLIVSTALSIVGTAATGLALGLIGVDSDSPLGYLAGRAVTIALVVVIDSAVIGTLLTLLAGIRIPFRHLWTGSLLGGVGAAVLTVLFQLGILGGAGSNPLLASFVAILGLLVYFNFICQVLLIAASYVATELADVGVSVRPKEVERMPRHARPSVPGPTVRRSR